MGLKQLSPRFFLDLKKLLHKKNFNFVQPNEHWVSKYHRAAGLWRRHFNLDDFSKRSWPKALDSSRLRRICFKQIKKSFQDFLAQQLDSSSTWSSLRMVNPPHYQGRRDFASQSDLEMSEGPSKFLEFSRTLVWFHFIFVWFYLNKNQTCPFLNYLLVLCWEGQGWKILSQLLGGLTKVFL